MEGPGGGPDSAGTDTTMSRTRLLRQPGRDSMRGQSILEFALVFPVLVLLLAGIADLSRWYSSAIGVEAAAATMAPMAATTPPRRHAHRRRRRL